MLFAGEAHLASPLTRDVAAWQGLVARATPYDVATGGTHIGRALATARDALLRARAATGHAAVVLLTDGEDVGGGEAGAAAREEAARLAAQGWALHVVPLGTARGAKIPSHDPEGAPFLVDAQQREVVSTLDIVGLQALARVGGGQVFEMSRAESQLLRTLADAPAETSTMPRIYFLLIAAFVLLFAWALRSVPGGYKCDGEKRDGGRRGGAMAWLRGRAKQRARIVRGAVASACVLALLGCGEARALVEQAHAAQAAGDLAAARAAYVAARGQTSGDARRIVDHNLARLALVAQAWGDAATHADQLASGAGDAWETRAAFVRGHVAYAQSLQLEQAALRPGADPRLRARAVVLAEDALAAWRAAAQGDADLPAARANVERALLRVAALREHRRTGGKARPQPQRPPPPPSPSAHAGPHLGGRA